MKQELWLIWKNPKDRRRHIIGILNKYPQEYVFKYDISVMQEVAKVGFDYFPGFEITDKTYTSNELFTNIKSRLPNLTRPDYVEILEAYGLNINNTEMEILEKTRGRLLTDDFEFVPYFNKENIEFDVAGTRHCDDIKKCREQLKIGDSLKLEMEPANKYDNNAIKVIYGMNVDYKIGYVPRYYSKELTELLRDNVKYNAEIISLNINSKISDEIITAKVKLIISND